MIAIIGCGKSKLRGRHSARELYTGNLFAAHLRLAEALAPRALYVVSAKHGLTGIDDEIDFYELELKSLGPRELGDWRRGVAAQVESAAEDRELVLLLSGSDYASWIDSCHRRVVQPLAGMMVGERLRFVGLTVTS